MPTDSKTEIAATTRDAVVLSLRCMSEATRATTDTGSWLSHDGAILAAAADLLESNAREIEQLEKERDEAVSRADELEANAEQVSVEFEKECGQALRTLMTECGFEWGYIPPEGVTAEHALEYLREALADIRAAARDVTARASALEAERDKLREGLRPFAEAAAVFDAAPNADPEYDVVGDDTGLLAELNHEPEQITVGHLRAARTLLTPAASGADKGGGDV